MVRSLAFPADTTSLPPSQKHRHALAKQRRRAARPVQQQTVLPPSIKQAHRRAKKRQHIALTVLLRPPSIKQAHRQAKQARRA